MTPRRPRSASGAPRGRIALVAAAACASAALAGCASVAPWERGQLALPQMSPDPAPAARAYRDHVHATREAAMETEAAEGGGCGCY
ncbi:MAG: DUF4266 domain-containing protein [Myxococcota bacterium]